MVNEVSIIGGELRFSKKAAHGAEIGTRGRPKRVQRRRGGSITFEPVDSSLEGSVRMDFVLLAEALPQPFISILA